MLDLAGRDPAVAHNRRQYDGLVRLAEAAARSGDLEALLASATVAGNSAWLAPTGMLCDPHLEGLIADAFRGDSPLHVRRAAPTERVLHVLTEAYTVGGHTRLATRWMQRDSRQSDIVLTSQRSAVPPAVTAAAAACGSRVIDLRSRESSLVGRAHQLRRVMEAYDLVVLHVHPFDAVTVAAANLPGSRPPIIFEDHADHAFWLGVSAADVVMHHRVAGQAVATQLRGIPPSRLGLLPLPIESPETAGLRASIRRRLAFGPRTVAAVSVASEYKMTPVWGEGFDTLLAPALEENPQLVVLLVGATPGADWDSALRRFPRRLFHVGVQPDPEAFYAAADIYLDSFPLSGATSILEAAMCGLPVLVPPSYEGLSAIYQSNSPGLDGAQCFTRSRDEWLQALNRLVRDPKHRASQAQKARRSVRTLHTGESWRAAMEDLYALALNAPPAALPEESDRMHDDTYGGRLAAVMRRVVAGTVSANWCAQTTLDAVDSSLGRDLYIVSALAERRRRGDLSEKLSIRLPQHWESKESWMHALITMAEDFPRLAVSLPLAADDDGSGSRTSERLLALAESVGIDLRTSCDFTIDPTAPLSPDPAVRETLDFTDSGLRLLEDYLTSAGWTPASRTHALSGRNS